jgi:hypothetical protein
MGNYLAANCPNKHELSLSLIRVFSRAFAAKNSNQRSSAQICGEPYFVLAMIAV